MHDLLAAARVLEDEAGKPNGPAMASLLDVPEGEARQIVKAVIADTVDVWTSAVESYGPGRLDPVYMLACAVRLGVQLGVAAERLRRAE